MGNPFAFLAKGVTVEEVTKPKGGGAVGPRKQRNPNPAVLAIRLFKDGSVYPSQAAVDKFNLEYKPATITKDEKNRNVYAYQNGQGNGFDIIDSRQWNSYKAEGDMLFIAAVDKGEPKVDLFKQAAYDETTGQPISSVMDQGTASFGKAVLIPAVEELYGIKFGSDAAKGEMEFVDLMICDTVAGINIPEALSPKNGYALFPKRIIRGNDAGKPDYQRREKPVIYALIPSTLLEEAQQEVPQPEKKEDESQDFEAQQPMQEIPVDEVEKLPYRPQQA
jgi:hypothetical protein